MPTYQFRRLLKTGADEIPFLTKIYINIIKTLMGGQLRIKTHFTALRNRALGVNFDNFLSFEQINAFGVMPQIGNCFSFHRGRGAE
jgi:hypothetical protein